MLWTLARIHAHANGASTAIYYPHGILHLLPGRPPAVAIAIATWVGAVATIAFVLGAFTRGAHVVGLVAILFVASCEASGKATWSHQSVPPLLASFALLGARVGDALSIDAWRRRRRGARLAVDYAYQAPARLVLMTVASVFFIAACVKLASGGLRGAWILSDNLRNQLLLRFDWAHVPRTRAADWIVERPWRWHTCALLNVLCQLAPIGAVFAIDRPRVRVALGLVWVAEILGLGIVMAYWDVQWLPLAAVFVDWERTCVAPPPAAQRTLEPPTLARRRYTAGFLAFYALQAFALDQKLDCLLYTSPSPRD